MLPGEEIFSQFFFCQIPSVSSEELTLPRPARCELSSLPQSQPSFVLLPMQENTEGEFLQRLRTSSAGSNSYFLLDCSVPEPFRRAMFGTTSSGPDLGGVARLPSQNFSALPFLGRGWIVPLPRSDVYLFSCWSGRQTVCNSFPIIWPTWELKVEPPDSKLLHTRQTRKPLGPMLAVKSLSLWNESLNW